MRFLPFLVLSLALSASALHADDAPAVAKPTDKGNVTLTVNGDTWTLDNGIVKATINKRTGNMPGLEYQGISLMAKGGTWEVSPSGEVTPSVTIDPAKNGGDRAEVSVKGIDGKMDIETRYTMERGASGLYTYAIYTHAASYPEAGFGENRFINQMQPIFDWLSVDADRNMLMCSDADEEAGVVIHAKEQRILSTGIYKNSVEHKYSYCGVMYKLPAYGWSDTKDHIGIYFINPSTEYIGGGAEKLDLVCHMGATMLDYWTSGHYAGGANCSIPAGEEWTKVVGPIFIYLNTLAHPKTPSQQDLDTLAATAGNPTVPDAWKQNGTVLFQDALDEAKIERAKWPYDWVQGVDYAHKNERGAVTGQFELKDPQAASTKLPNLTVGLAHADYTGNGSSFQHRAGNGDTVKWPHDGNYYQFWTDGTDEGKFTIPNVRPGNYTLHAFADGVLGEFEQANITVKAGQALDLGKIAWTPVRHGKQIWEIGYPDRASDEFFKGDGANYWRWGWPVRYPLLFPNDVTFTIGKSDWHKDWFFEQVPHGETTSWLNPDAKDPANQPFGWMMNGTAGEDMWRTIGHGRDNTWTIKFNMDMPTRGLATLRIALAGADGGNGLAIEVNGKSVGTIHPVATNALRYNTDKGVWQECDLPFDAGLLKSGENEMKLTVPAGDLTTGVVYDYLRLEVDKNQKAPSASPP